MRPRNGSCSFVKWTAAGRRGRHGRSVMRTVVDIDSASVTVRRHCTTADTVTATTSVPTTARRSSAPVRHADYFAGLQWRQNFYPHTHPISIPMGISMGIPIPTAESRAAVGTEFLSPYPPHIHTHGDPHTHGRVQGCRGDGISIPIPTPYGPYPYSWGSSYPRQTCYFSICFISSVRTRSSKTNVK